MCGTTFYMYLCNLQTSLYNLILHVSFVGFLYNLILHVSFVGFLYNIILHVSFVGFLYAVEALKSVFLSISLADKEINVQRAVLLSRLEQEYQV